MTELEKCELAKSKGYTYCPVSGELRGVLGNVITNDTKEGYIRCVLRFQEKRFFILGHRLSWYLHYGHLPVNSIDHIDGVRSNNKIENLRDVTAQQNQWNHTKAKGYYWNKPANKFCAHIKIDRIKKHLGYYSTEQEARNAYLKAKEIYHVINT
jgi:hypothetical protein